MTFLIILAVITAITVGSLIIISFIRKRKAQNNIVSTLKQFGKVKAVRKTYDYIVDTNSFVFLIKVVYNFAEHEISINNKNYWQLNDTVVASKKSGTKIEGIYDLINNDTFSFNKPHKKVYVVYPSSRVLVKAVNESELTFITPEMDCYGVNVVKFDEIKEIFKK